MVEAHAVLHRRAGRFGNGDGRPPVPKSDRNAGVILSPFQRQLEPGVGSTLRTMSRVGAVKAMLRV